MDTAQLVGSVGIYAGTFVVAVVGCFIPIASIEVFLVGIVLAGRMPAAVPLVVAIAAAGQLLGKLPIFYATRKLSARSARIERMRAWLERKRIPPAVMLAASAVLGLPPFTIAATAAGALAIRPRTFCVVVGLGRALRFAAVIMLATLG